MKIIGHGLVILALASACEEESSHTETHAIPESGEHQHHNDEIKHDHLDHLDHQQHQSETASAQDVSDYHLFRVNISWPDQLTTDSTGNDLSIMLTKPDHSTLPTANLVSVQTYMSTHGHGSDTSSIEIIPDSVMPNMWQVQGVVFSMPGSPGDWQLVVEAEVDGVIDRAIHVINKEVN